MPRLVVSPSKPELDPGYVIHLRSVGGRQLEGQLSRLLLEVISSEDPSEGRLSRLSIEVLVFTRRRPLFIPRKAWPSAAISFPHLRTYFTHPNLPSSLSDAFVKFFSQLSRQDSRQELLNYRTLEEYSRGTHTRGIPNLRWRSYSLPHIANIMSHSGFTATEVQQYSPVLISLFDTDARLERNNYTTINKWLVNAGTLTIPHPNFLTRRLDNIVSQLVQRGVVEPVAKAIVQCIYRWRVSQSHDERLNYRVIEEWANG